MARFGHALKAPKAPQQLSKAFAPHNHKVVLLGFETAPRHVLGKPLKTSKTRAQPSKAFAPHKGPTSCFYWASKLLHGTFWARPPKLFLFSWIFLSLSNFSACTAVHTVRFYQSALPPPHPPPPRPPPPPRLAVLFLLVLLLASSSSSFSSTMSASTSTCTSAFPTLRQALCQVSSPSSLPTSQLSVHRWTSTWDRPSSVCTAGPQPGTCPARCAPLDLNLGPSQLSVHRWTSTWDLPSSVCTAGPQRPNRMPEDMPDRMPEDMSEHMPEDMSDRMPDRMPEDMSEYMPEDMPDRMPDRMPEDMPDRMPEGMPDRMPEDLPDRMPEDMPEDMPDRMPDRMPEDISDRMPEDLPVRKSMSWWGSHEVKYFFTSQNIIACKQRRMSDNVS